MYPNGEWMSVVYSVIGLAITGLCLWICYQGYGIAACVVFVVGCLCLAKLEG